jgi:leader peptidase (prepilin peptidase)/N-methyltransferase
MNGSWWAVLIAALAGTVSGACGGVLVARELGAVSTTDRVALTAVTALGWAAATGYLGVSWSLPAVLYLVVGAAVLTLTDLRAHRLPNRLVLGSYPVVAGLLLLAVADDTRAWPSLLAAAAGGVGVFLLFLVAALTGPLGGGDVKLAGLVGAYLGWAGGGSGVVLGVVVTVVSAAVVAGIGLGLGRWQRDSQLAYGPFLLLGCLVGVAVNL